MQFKKRKVGLVEAFYDPNKNMTSTTPCCFEEAKKIIHTVLGIRWGSNCHLLLLPLGQQDVQQLCKSWRLSLLGFCPSYLTLLVSPVSPSPSLPLSLSPSLPLSFSPSLLLSFGKISLISDWLCSSFSDSDVWFNYRLAGLCLLPASGEGGMEGGGREGRSGREEDGEGESVD